MFNFKLKRSKVSVSFYYLSLLWDVGAKHLPRAVGLQCEVRPGLAHDRHSWLQQPHHRAWLSQAGTSRHLGESLVREGTTLLAAANRGRNSPANDPAPFLDLCAAQGQRWRSQDQSGEVWCGVSVMCMKGKIFSYYLHLF